MKILVLEPRPAESADIFKALEPEGHTLVKIDASEQALPLILAGEEVFLIADWDSSDLASLQFIPRARLANESAALYILLLRDKAAGSAPPPAGIDDILHKPFTHAELKSRLVVGERILSLGSSLVRARDQLESQAMLDPLTGLMNRPALLHQAAAELERARRATAPISFIALDIDTLQAINTAHGKEAGDEVLRAVGRALREKSRPYDCMGRWEADEFLVVLPGVFSADAEKIAERLINAVAGLTITSAQFTLPTIGASAGIAAAMRIGAASDLEPFIHQARQAMARAKESGGNQVFLINI